MDIDEMPEHELNEDVIYHEINLSQQQQAAGGLINTPRINEPNQKEKEREKENILFVRKSDDLGLTYYNQHNNKKSFEINDDNAKIQFKDKDKKNIVASNNIKNKNAGIAPNSNKIKEKRSLTPNMKEQMKFEGKIKKSVQRQFIKTTEEKKTVTIRKK